MELTDAQKRELFTNALQNVAAVKFPSQEDYKQIIYLVFVTKEYQDYAADYLWGYSGTGFSLIIEQIDEHRIILKIFEIDTDDFHECNKVLIEPDVLNEYKDYYRHENGEMFLSLGILIVNPDGGQRIDCVPLLVPLKSVSFP